MIEKILRYSLIVILLDIGITLNTGFFLQLILL